MEDDKQKEGYNEELTHIEAEKSYNLQSVTKDPESHWM